MIAICIFHLYMLVVGQLVVFIDDDLVWFSYFAPFLFWGAEQIMNYCPYHLNYYEASLSTFSNDLLFSHPKFDISGIDHPWQSAVKLWRAW